MGFACVDVCEDADVGAFLTELHRAVGAIPVAADSPGSTIDFDGHRRFSLCADYGNIWLGQVIADVARATGALRRAVIGLDHDEYGAENIVIDGTPARVHHVYVYPSGRPDGETAATLLGVPARAGLPVAGDGTVDGPLAWAAAAELYGVPVDRMAAAAEKAVHAHRELQIVFAPFAPWWEALGVSYPDGE
jgi:hypothetical protein